MRAIICLLIASAAASAADRDFKDIVRGISDHYRTRPVNIPFFGLVNAFTFVARPAGTSHIDLAIFEDLRRPMDPDDLRHIVGNSWKPFVQVFSRRSGGEETTLIYMQPDGRDTRLLIATTQHREATVVQLKLNLESLKRWIDEPKYSASSSKFH